MDYILLKEISTNLSSLLTFVAEYAFTLGFVFGPLIGYVSQYNLIKKQGSVGSFSTDVCAILIFANILRILFWFGKFYETPLLLQSIIMIAMQLALLKLCIDTKQNAMYKDKEEKSFFESPIKQFWRWNQLSSYIASILSFTIGATILCSIFSNIKMFWEIVGFCSCAVEATLGLPQAMKNHQSKSVAGLSYMMILTWVFGDAFKTYYYVVQQAPSQFVFCGITQLIVDFWIIGQIATMKEQLLEI